MNHTTIRAELTRMLGSLDELGEFGAACFLSMAIDALGGSGIRMDPDSLEGAFDPLRPAGGGQSYAPATASMPLHGNAGHPGRRPPARTSPQGNASPSA